MGSLVVLLALVPGLALESATASGTGADAQVQATQTVDLHFFWTTRCPHCVRARPFVEALAEREPWLRLHAHQLTGNEANVRRYVEMAGALGHEARSVPGFIFCGQLFTGYGSDETTGAELARRLIECRDRDPLPEVDAATGSVPAEADTSVALPFLGAVDLASYSLPALTLVLGGLDSFNPCAFFVLLFLLSLLVHARSRVRILFIGGTFVFISGAIYFVFMAAWLNAFLLMGEIAIVTLAAGAVAVVLALLNIKEYAWPGRGPSLAIADSARPGLFQRMRRLVVAERMPAMLAGTAVLALAANTYELLCTAGFPMVYTRVLTLSGVSPATHYLYLALYNVVYVLPLLLVVCVFALTLGSRKLGEREGRVLKLVSGLMMLELGTALIVHPGILGNVLGAAGMLLGAVVLTALIEIVRRRVASGGNDVGTTGVG